MDEPERCLDGKRDEHTPQQAKAELLDPVVGSNLREDEIRLVQKAPSAHACEEQTASDEEGPQDLNQENEDWTEQARRGDGSCNRCFLG